MCQQSQGIQAWEPSPPDREAGDHVRSTRSARRHPRPSWPALPTATGTAAAAAGEQPGNVYGNNNILGNNQGNNLGETTWGGKQQPGISNQGEQSGGAEPGGTPPGLYQVTVTRGSTTRGQPESYVTARAAAFAGADAALWATARTTAVKRAS
jgi:hypothetical protein